VVIGFIDIRAIYCNCAKTLKVSFYRKKSQMLDRERPAAFTGLI